jgi:8-oxo-dGTP pyrophosphatase MutT (NUDIX family)
MQTKQDLIKTYPDIDINNEGGPDAYNEDLPIVERDPIAVIIKHPKENLYLLADWENADWKGFLTGGIEDGDTLEATVKKEVYEETGYKNISKIVLMNFTSHALFYHPVKNVNRLAHYHLVFAELLNLDKDVVSEEESRIAKFIWVPFEEVSALLTRKGMKLLWNFYSNSLTV